MRRLIGFIALAVATVLAPGAQPAGAVTITSFVGDIDCFGLGGTCADGTGLGFVDLPDTGPGLMDTDNYFGVSDSWTHVYAPIAGTVLSATLTIRVYDLGTIGDDDLVSLNGTQVLSRPDDLTNLDQVRTLVIPIPLLALQYDGSEAVLFAPSVGEYWAVDYSRLDIEVEAVPEPATLVLLGSGLAGMALRRRRQQS